MRRTARVLGGLLVVAVAATLSACAPPVQVVSDSWVVVATDTEVRVINPGSHQGSGAARLGLPLALYSGFATPDESGELVPDRSFGEVAVLDEDPLTVRYTVADAARWSDGVPVDGVDLLLDWAAHSGRWSAFSAARTGKAAGSEVPSLSADRKSLTLVLDGAADVDPLRQFTAPMPAHVVAMHALGADSPEAAKDAVLAAVDAADAGDPAALADLARFWNARFTVHAPSAVMVASGPYRIAATSDRSLELRPNPQYAGDRRPRIESVRIVSLPPFDGVQALAIEAADVLAVTPSEELAELVPSLGLRVLTGGTAVNTLVAVQRQTVGGVEVGRDGRGLLRNVADWTSLR